VKVLWVHLLEKSLSTITKRDNTLTNLNETLCQEKVDVYHSRICSTSDFGAHIDVSSHSAINTLLQLAA